MNINTIICVHTILYGAGCVEGRSTADYCIVAIVVWVNYAALNSTPSKWPVSQGSAINAVTCCTKRYDSISNCPPCWLSTMRSSCKMVCSLLATRAESLELERSLWSTCNSGCHWCADEPAPDNFYDFGAGSVCFGGGVGVIPIDSTKFLMPFLQKWQSN